MGFVSTSPIRPLRGNRDRAPDETTGWSIAKKCVARTVCTDGV